MTNEEFPSGLKLRNQFAAPRDIVKRVAWSPDGNHLAASMSSKANADGSVCFWNVREGTVIQTLEVPGTPYGLSWSPDGRSVATGSSDRVVRIWDAVNGSLRQTLQPHMDMVISLAWSPNGQYLASGSDDATVHVTNLATGLTRTLGSHRGFVQCVSWSPDGGMLASASSDSTVLLWSTDDCRLLTQLVGHGGTVYAVAWSPGGHFLASGSSDRTIRLWVFQDGRGTLIRILEGHTKAITSLSFSSDSRLLASKSRDGTVRLWDCRTWDSILVLDEPHSSHSTSGLAFHPSEPTLATLGFQEQYFRVWDLDRNLASPRVPVPDSLHYTNARVVLVGDTGVGKSGLAMVLSGQEFAPTDSTHGRKVWTCDTQHVKLDDGTTETRETLLWDLAGQPGYRLIHQLHLDQITVALLVFDGRTEIDPFAGIRYWDRALRPALTLNGTGASVKKFLVAARCDRGGSGVSTSQMQAVVQELHLDGYFETSAREGWNVPALLQAIQRGIPWDALPRTTSSQLLHHIRCFLMDEKQAGRTVATMDELYRLFLKSLDDGTVVADGLSAQFETCIVLLESHGLARRLGFGSLVLLQPEFLDAYAAAIVQAARDSSDGLGTLREEEARSGSFRLAKTDRIRDPGLEQLVLISTIEHLLHHEVALREYSPEGPLLIFPSQFTRARPDLPVPMREAVAFEFSGPALNIYATLAVRLAHSGIFKKQQMWRDGATYTTSSGGVYGVSMRTGEEGRGDLLLLFDTAAGQHDRRQFEAFVHSHVLRRSAPDSVRRRSLVFCPSCGQKFTGQQIEMRQARGFDRIRCPICETPVLLNIPEVPKVRATVTSIERVADARRELDTAASLVTGKKATGDFDVFLCYHGPDRADVEDIAGRLQELGLLPWFDVWELRPGLPWQQVLESQIKDIRSAAVFLGPAGVGNWQEIEARALLQQFLQRKCPIIPVILPLCSVTSELPAFLSGMTWVDFRNSEPDPLEQLVWGITGERVAGGRSGRATAAETRRLLRQVAAQG